MLRKARAKLMPVELWESLEEMWLHNWEQLNLTGKPQWLIKKDRERTRKISAKRFEIAFFSLHDQYSAIVGGNKIMEKYRILVEKLTEARAKVAKDKSQKNWVRQYEAQIKQLMKPDEDGPDMIKQRMIVQKLYGQRINPKDTTVGEYIRITQVVNETKDAGTNTE